MWVQSATKENNKAYALIYIATHKHTRQQSSS